VNRNTISLAGAVAALVVLTGAASLTGGNDSTAAPAGSAARLPVQRSTLLCPAPSTSEFATTTYTSFTPQGTTSGSSSGSDSSSGSSATTAGRATLLPAVPKAKPLTPLTATGKPVTTTTDKTDAPALIGGADGPLAPGWTVQQSTVVDSGSARGLLGTSCLVPDSEFWIPGASTVSGRQDYLHLVNPDEAPAVVDVQLYGRNGLLKASTGDGITVPGNSSEPVLLSTLVADKEQDLTVHVVARSGRVGAAVQATDSGKGADWLPAAADPGTQLVMPGIPADATDVRLIAFATGSDDADLTLKLATSTGSIVPAGHETVHVKSGMTTAVDLGDVTKGDAGSLILGSSTVHSAVPVVAALRITRGKGSSQELAFLPSTAPVGTRSTVADNRAKGSTLALTAPGAAATVKITSSAGSSGGTPATSTVTVKAGATLSLAAPQPGGGKGIFALTVQPVSGGPVYASRMLALPQGGVPMFTIQPMPDDRGLVAVPDAGSDLRILNR
jgi:LysM repeat protein